MPEEQSPTPIDSIKIPDFEANKIETFEGINDEPIPPTSTEGSNISHVHDSINKLIDSVISGHTELRKAIQYNHDYAYNNYQRINDNYNYLYDKIDYYTDENRDLINNNAVTISNNRLDANNRLIGLEQDIESVNTKINELDAILNPNESTFEFTDVSLSPYANDTYIYDITIPKTGTLQYIYLNDTWDGNDNSFTVDGGALFEETGTSEDNNYIYAYIPSIYYQDVTENQILRLTSTNNDTAITRIKIKITASDNDAANANAIVQINNKIAELETNIAQIQATLSNTDNQNNQTEFIINNVSFTNDGLYENYLITVPKTGTLTKIEFNDVNQLSEIYIEYSGVDQTTTENIGSDENYPYVLDLTPTVPVNNQDTLRIYTEYEELTLTSIKITIV